MFIGHCVRFQELGPTFFEYVSDFSLFQNGRTNRTRSKNSRFKRIHKIRQRFSDIKVRTDEIFIFHALENLGRCEIPSILSLHCRHCSRHDFHQRRHLLHWTKVRIRLDAERHHRRLVRCGLAHRGHPSYLLWRKAWILKAKSNQTFKLIWCHA